MIQLIIISAYLALLLGLGVIASRMFRGTSKDYMLASHSIGPFLLLMSLFGTTMTAFALVGSSGEAFKKGVGVYGMLASSSGIIHSLCFFLLGVKLWKLGRRHGYTTQIQFFRDRLESDKIGLLLFPVLVGLVIPYLLIGVMASGTVINAITEGAFTDSFAIYDYGVPPWLGSLVICLIVLIYVFFGGMRGTAWANTFQTLVFMVLGVLTFFIIANKLGGLQKASEAVAEKHPSRLIRDVAPKDQERFDKQFASWQTLAEFNYATKKIKSFELTAAQKEAAFADFKPRMLAWQARAQAAYAKKNGLLADLTIAQRNDAFVWQDDRNGPQDKPPTWSTKLLDAHALNEYQRKPGTDASAFVIFKEKIGHPNKFINEDETQGKNWTRKKAKGVYRATKWSPTLPDPTDPIVFLTYFFVPLSVGMFPHLFQHWLTARSAGAFKLPVVAHPIFIMIVWVPCVLVGVWATSAVNPETGRALFAPHFPANAVLASLVKQLTTPMLAGLLTAGILAAIMSSLDSQFLSIGTMFTSDVVVHYGGKNRFSDRQILMTARLFIIAIVAITYGFSLMEPRRVFTLGVWCFSGFSSLFPLVLAALYWKRLTKIGAYACIVAAIGSWGALFYASEFALNTNYYFLGMMPVATMIACSTIAMVLFSLLTKPPSEDTLSKFFNIN